MESKVKEYQELHGKFEEIYEQVSTIENPIRDIEKEIRQLRNKQNEVDYNNADVVISYMDIYIDESITKQKETIKSEVDNKMSDLISSSGQVKKNFVKAVEWLSVKKIKQYLQSAEIDFEQAVYAKSNPKAIGLNVFTILNKVFSFAFRFDFLRFLKEGYRIIISIIFWAIFLIPKLITLVYNKFQIIYDNEYAHLTEQEYELVGDQFTKDFLGACISSIVIAAILIIVINITVYIVGKILAKKFILDNKVLCFSFIDSDGIKLKMYNYNVNKYMKNVVSIWKSEVETIRNNGLSGDYGSDSLIALVKEDLFGKWF